LSRASDDLLGRALLRGGGGLLVGDRELPEVFPRPDACLDLRVGGQVGVAAELRERPARTAEGRLELVRVAEDPDFDVPAGSHQPMPSPCPSEAI
jgi:hypothetical protein